MSRQVSRQGSRHRADAVRPRRGRIALVAAAVMVTGVAVVGGVANADGDGPTVARDKGSATAAPADVRATGATGSERPGPSDGSTEASAPAEPDLSHAEDSATDARKDVTGPGASLRVVRAPTLHRDKNVPDDSGTGRRIVFSETRQRVWLIDDDESVERTYLVSGSLYDNLDPGSYAVFSRSEQAYGVDDSGTMEYFVRFAEGPNAAIGFHDIPVSDGQLIQSNAELGTPQSHGCIRQKQPDAIALWDFAPIGTEVVVTA